MRRNMLSIVGALGLATAGLGCATAANAAAIINPDGSVTFSNPGDALSDTVLVSFNGLGGDPKALTPGLSGLLTLTLDSIVGSVFNFSYAMKNTSSVTGTGISGFGFNADPDATGVSATGFFDQSGLNANFASLAAEVCVNGGPGTCPQASGPQQLDIGLTGIGNLALTVTGTPSSVTLSNFLDRYQGFSTTNINGDAVTSAVGRGTVFPSIRAPVPEPSTWMMMIFGFGAIGAFMRKRRRGVADRGKLAFA